MIYFKKIIKESVQYQIVWYQIVQEPNCPVSNCPSIHKYTQIYLFSDPISYFILLVYHAE